MIAIQPHAAKGVVEHGNSHAGSSGPNFVHAIAYSSMPSLKGSPSEGQSPTADISKTMTAATWTKLDTLEACGFAA